MLAAARELFALRGYGDVELDQIARRAGVSLVELERQYPGGKDQVFGAVAVALSAETARAVRSAALRGETPLAELERGIDAFLDACTAPAVRRILLLDVPAVLGREVWQAVDAEYGLRVLEERLQRAIDAGQLAPGQPARAAAHVLLGALEQAAGTIASAEDALAARDEMAPTVHRLLEGLRAPLG